MSQEKQYLDNALSEQDKYYLYITLPMSVGESSMAVERFLDEVWKQQVTPESLKAFSNSFWKWNMENTDEQTKLAQIECDARSGVFSERDICALVQSYRERCAEVAAIPVDGLLAIEEIAPLVAHDVIGDPATWMKAWDEVSPWLATLKPEPHPENPWMFGEIG